jgi:peptidoglycan hydrolase CwlO-like protein
MKSIPSNMLGTTLKTISCIVLSNLNNQTVFSCGVESEIQGAESEIQGAESEIQGVESEIQGVETRIGRVESGIQKPPGLPHMG